jgi:hypothetical protein
MRRIKDSKAAKVASQKILGSYLQRPVVAQRLQRQTQAMIKKLNARMDGGEICSLSRKQKLQVSVLVFVLESVFLWFFYFQVEFMSNQRKLKRSLRRN